MHPFLSTRDAKKAEGLVFTAVLSSLMHLGFYKVWSNLQVEKKCSSFCEAEKFA
jgi:hypothetical protein